ncbi:cupin domain-containing protein [Peptostreptococcaceae bacterium OttesenSCG-928-C18]|nr:cupin domain-containing protein [Peptostreptococcaceae bacterium OttesenSCG-928-C18]
MKLAKNKILEQHDLVEERSKYSISKRIVDKADIFFFSLPGGMDISEEEYTEEKLYYVLKGKLSILGKEIDKNESLVVPENTLFGIEALEDSIFLEIAQEDKMKNIVKEKVFKLKDQIEVVEDSISSVDIISNENIKLALMAFDKGQSLPTHSAPGNVLVLALEGKAEVTLNGKTSIIEEGEQISFETGASHSVKALEKYKMGLLIIK